MSAHDEVLFRNEEDIRVGVNCYALSLFMTESESYSDAFMSNHIHFMVNTYDIQNFSLIFKSRYSIYFQHKYKRKHLCKEASTFFTEIDGPRHRLAAINYVNRNGLHHGRCSTALGYEHSSVNCFFKSELGKKNVEHTLLQKNEIMGYLPLHSNLPDNYSMDDSGMFTRESFTQISQVELLYGSPRSFLYLINRPSSEKWDQEQNEDNNGKEPITLSHIEQGATDTPIKILLDNEYGRYDKSKMSDMDVCKIIDNAYLSQYHKKSIYQLDMDEKRKIATSLSYEYRVSHSQIKRCLAMMF